MLPGSRRSMRSLARSTTTFFQAASLTLIFLWWCTEKAATSAALAGAHRRTGGNCFVSSAAWVDDSRSPAVSRRCCSRSRKRFTVAVLLRKATVVLQSSLKEDDDIGFPTPTNGGAPQEYRSIADVVGGLHGGKYQFGGEGMVSDVAFSGNGGGRDNYDYQEYDTEANGNVVEEEQLPNWAKKMAPNEFKSETLVVPSNSDPMDGMVYFASIQIQNQERTWEKFYAKIVTKQQQQQQQQQLSEGAVGEYSSNSSFATVDAGLSVSPASGFLAPRGGASNACDASQPYSDTATIKLTQRSKSSSNSSSIVPKDASNDLWLVVGTEEEQWTYKLDLLEH